MRQVRLSRHARKRITKGDHFGRRTVLTPDRVRALAASPAVIKTGRYLYAYSPADNKTLTIVTAQQGRIIVTVFGTHNLPNRLVDMLARKRAGAHFSFTELPMVPGVHADSSTKITLGTYREKKGMRWVTDLVELGSYPEFDPDRPGVIETEELHRLLVGEGKRVWAQQLVSATAMRRLHVFFYSANQRFTMMPLRISFELFGEDYPGLK